MPTLEKTYIYNCNRQVGDITSRSRSHDSLRWTMKDSLVDAGCTVWGSSDAQANWGNTGEDYWTSVDPLGGRYGNYAWVVLNFVGGSQILIQRGSIEYNYTFEYSPGGLYTGGGLTTKPTATDYFEWRTNEQIGELDAFIGYLHVVASDDGDNAWIVYSSVREMEFAWLLMRLQDPVDNWEEPQHVHLWEGNPASLTTRDLGPGEYGGDFRYRYNGQRQGGLATLGVTTICYTDRAEAIEQSWSGNSPMTRCGFADIDVGSAGRHGRVADFYMINGIFNDGDTMEADAATPTYEWAIFGSICIPWDGTPVVMR